VQQQRVLNQARFKLARPADMGCQHAIARQQDRAFLADAVFDQPLSQGGTPQP
jgi:hypothetical protein